MPNSFARHCVDVFLSFIAGPLGATKSLDQGLPTLIPRSVLYGNPEKESPKISPDGKRLAYIAPVKGVLNIWVKTIGKQDDRPITKDTDRGIRNCFWAQNNKYLLYAQDNNGNECWHVYRLDLETGKIVDRTPFDGVTAFLYKITKNSPDEIMIGLNKENRKFFDVYHLNIETGKLELREKNPGNVRRWIVDDNLRVRAIKTFNDDGGASLLIRNTEKDPWKKIITYNFEDAGTVIVFGFSKDGKKLYIKDSFEANADRLIEYNVVSKTRKVLAQDPIFDVNGLLKFDISGLFKDKIEKPLAVSIKKERLTWLALDDEFAPILQAMQKVDTGDLYIGNASNDGCYWIIRFVSDNKPESFYLFNAKEKKSELLFSTRPKLDDYQLASTKPISYTSRDGLKIHGYLTCPVGVEQKNLPIVFLVHGGPWLRDSWSFDPQVQWFANRGYACLQVNYRGSSGYGKSFLNAGNREWGGKMHDDLIDGVNWAIKQKIADPKKIAIFGGSYGGYSALLGATFTPDVFCCAVSAYGQVNLVTLLSSIPPYWISEKKRMDLRVGDPEKDAEFLISRSPLSKVGNIKIPIFLAYGANDIRVKQTEAEQLIATIKEKNIPYEYILFPDEGHGFVKPENRLKFYAAAEKFLARHMGGRCEA